MMDKLMRVILGLMIIGWLACTWLLIANAEMGYYKTREVVTTKEVTYRVIDKIEPVPVINEEGKETGEFRDKAIYKDVSETQTTVTYEVDDTAAGARLMSGTTPSPAWMGKDLREVAEIKKPGWKALVLHEMRVAWWDTSENPPVFRRTTIQEWAAAGKPAYVELHPWRKPSGMGWMRGITEAQLQEVLN